MASQVFTWMVMWDFKYLCLPEKCEQIHQSYQWTHQVSDVDESYTRRRLDPWGFALHKLSLKKLRKRLRILKIKANLQYYCHLLCTFSLSCRTCTQLVNVTWKDVANYDSKLIHYSDQPSQRKWYDLFDGLFQLSHSPSCW